MPGSYPEIPKHMLQSLLYNQLCHIHVPEVSALDEYINDAGERVSARQLTADSVTVISVWCQGMPVVEHDALDYDMTFQALNVPTTDGPKRATQGDYVVRTADGSFDVVKAYQFRSNFREA